MFLCSSGNDDARKEKAADDVHVSGPSGEEMLLLRLHGGA